MPTVNLGPCECCGGDPCDCGGVNFETRTGTWTLISASPTLQEIPVGTTETVQGINCSWLVGDSTVPWEAYWVVERRNGPSGFNVYVSGSMSGALTDSQGRRVLLVNQLGDGFTSSLQLLPSPCTLPFTTTHTTLVYEFGTANLLGSLEWEIEVT